MATPAPQSEIVSAGAPLAVPSRISARRQLVRGFLPLALVVLFALLAPLIAQYDPERANPVEALQAPSSTHWFGTNSYGGDVFSRVAYAARLDLLIGFVSVAGSFLIAAPLGAAVGYSRRWWAGLVMRLMDFIQSFPLFIIAMAFVTVSGPSTRNVIIVLGLLNIPIFVRLVRAEVLSLRERSFVEAARSLGNTTPQIIGKYVLPNALTSSIGQASVNVGWALLVTAGLGFVGAGVQPPTPEWGVMIGEGARYMITGEWWISVFPGLALGIAVLAFALAGDALGRLLDVKARSGG